MYAGFRLGSVKERDICEYIGADGNMVLRRILLK